MSKPHALRQARKVARQLADHADSFRDTLARRFDADADEREMIARRVTRWLNPDVEPESTWSSVELADFIAQTELMAAFVDRPSPVPVADWLASTRLVARPATRTLEQRAAALSEVAEHWETDAPANCFHELFLAALDRQRRRRRGVFYTPGPVVNYLVRSAFSLLPELTPTDLTPPEVTPRFQLIDPAAGSGTFLSAALRQMPAGLDCDVRGFEILAGSCAVARLLVPNAAISWDSPFRRPTETADAAPVIVGNPPYSNFGRQNKEPWITELLADYAQGIRERKHNLNDDFVKFIRWAQHCVDRAGRGIVAMITSRTWLDGLTHRRMRESLLETFDEIRVLDLHGDASTVEDDNVFDIRRGVAIGIFLRRPRPEKGRREEGRLVERQPVMLQSRLLQPTLVQPTLTTVCHHEITGSRRDKFNYLRTHQADTTDWQRLAPNRPAFRLVPEHADRREYEALPGITEIFCEYISGVQTKRDELLIGMTREEVAEKVRAFLEVNPVAEFNADRIQPCLVTPFDRRFVYYDSQLVGRDRRTVMRHMLGSNVGLVFMRQSTVAGEYDHFLAVDCLVTDRVFYSTRGAPFLAPLYLNGISNIRPGFVAELAGRLKRSTRSIKPREIFNYAYGVFHSSAYRLRFAELLRTDFPRLPWPTDAEQFARLSVLGGELVELHVHSIGEAGRAMPESGRPAMGAVDASGMSEASEAGGRDLGSDQISMRVGGYDVPGRWRRQRARRPLTTEEEGRLQTIRMAVARTAAIRGEIDRYLNG